jgi:hypothetical protein
MSAMVREDIHRCRFRDLVARESLNQWSLTSVVEFRNAYAAT